MRSLRHVLYARWETDPRVHAVLVDRESRLRKVRICEGADWHADSLFVIACDCVVNRCTAVGAEIERDLASFISDSDVLL